MGIVLFWSVKETNPLLSHITAKHWFDVCFRGRRPHGAGAEPTGMYSRRAAKANIKSMSVTTLSG